MHVLTVRKDETCFLFFVTERVSNLCAAGVRQCGQLQGDRGYNLREGKMGALLGSLPTVIE